MPIMTGSRSRRNMKTKISKSKKMPLKKKNKFYRQPAKRMQLKEILQKNKCIIQSPIISLKECIKMLARICTKRISIRMSSNMLSKLSTYQQCSSKPQIPMKKLLKNKNVFKVSFRSHVLDQLRRFPNFPSKRIRK